MLKRFLKKWMPDVGESKVGQYLLLLVLLLIVTIMMYDHFGSEISSTIQKSLHSIIGGF